MSYKGRFKPQNPLKYEGDPTNIVFRSLWELKFMRYVDRHPQIIKWSSEEISIHYMSPIDGKKHRYFPDFVCKKVNTDGIVETYMIEIKPKSQTVEPDPLSKGKKTKTGKPTKRFLTEVKTWAINKAKWTAAAAYCHNRGWKFLIYTEKELGIK